MKLHVVLTAVGLGLAPAAPANAGFMTWAGVQGSSGVQPPNQQGFGSQFSDFWNTGGAGAGAGGGNGYGSAASASVSLGPNGGIRLFSSSVTGGSVTSVETIAGAGWGDVIRVSGGPAPAVLRIVLSVEGNLDLADPTIPGVITAGSARVGVALLPNSSAFGGTQVPQVAAFGNAYPVSEVVAAQQGAPYPDYGPTGAVSWNVEFNLNYNAAIGGYSMILYASAYTSAINGGHATADFGHTIRLTGVTNQDGSAVDGAVTFDSGYTLPTDPTAVPAPPGVVLALSAAATGLGFRLRRRR